MDPKALTTDQNVDPQIVNVARRMYKAYFRNANGKTHDGRVMPDWEFLTPLVRAHWCAAAMAAATDVAERIGNSAHAQGDKLRAELEAMRDELGEAKKKLAQLDADAKKMAALSASPNGGGVVVVAGTKTSAGDVGPTTLTPPAPPELKAPDVAPEPPAARDVKSEEDRPRGGGSQPPRRRS